MNSDSRTLRRQAPLFAADGMRSFAMGYFSIVFVIVARRLGLSALGLGIVTGISVAAGIVITHLLTKLAHRYGARTPLGISGVLMAGTGVVISLAHSQGVLFMSAFLGVLPPSGGMFISALVEGVLAQSPSERRTAVFARNGVIAMVTGAAGALFASFPTLLGMSQVEGLKFLIWFYVGIGIAVAAVSFAVIDIAPVAGARLPSGDESGSSPESQRFEHASGSNAVIHRLSILFILDSAGSGVVAPTLVVFWLRYHFSLGVVALSLLFFGMDVLSAISYPLAERISRKVGLLNTAVFTHIPSSLLLVAVPFAPGALAACLLLLGRSLLVKMDVPTRQSYVASVVTPESRRTAAAKTSMGRQAGRSVGPAIGGFLLSNVSATAPFIASAVMKISYDLILWRSFRATPFAEAAGTAPPLLGTRQEP